MPQVIRETTPGSNIGAQIGQGLQTGLSSGFQNLANLRLQEIAQRALNNQTSSFWEKATGNPELAKMISSSPDYIQKSLINRLNLGALGNMPQNQPLSQLQSQQPIQSELQQLLPTEISSQQPNVPIQPTATPIFGLSPQEEKLDIERKKLGMKEEAAEFARQEKVQPFLHAKAQDFTNAKKIYSIANRMLKNLRENRSKWPTISGYLPNIVQQDPDVRKYVADSNLLVTMLAGSRKGQPTNFKIKLEQQSKPELNQPIETQEQILQGLINDSKEEFDTQKEIQRIKEQHGGKYPRDLETRLLEKQNKKIEEPILPDPNEYLPDTIIEVDGKQYELKNNNWKPVG